jgi:hypothetical protein
MKMPISFFLQAHPRWDGSPVVREVYLFESDARATLADGSERPAVITTDFVDEAIKAAHPKEYAAFKATIDKDPEYNEEVAAEAQGALVSVVDDEAPIIEVLEEQKNEISDSTDSIEPVSDSKRERAASRKK